MYDLPCNSSHYQNYENKGFDMSVKTPQFSSQQIFLKKTNDQKPLPSTKEKLTEDFGNLSFSEDKTYFDDVSYVEFERSASK